MKDLGDLNMIIRDSNGISMNQEKYINEIVDRFNMHDSFDAYIPMLITIKFTSYMDPYMILMI